MRVMILKIGGRKGIPKNLSSQEFGEVRVNFLVWIITILYVEGPNCSENSWEVFGWFFAIERLPKWPFRTKNTTTILKIVKYYAVVILLLPPNLLRRGPFFERKTVCNSQDSKSPRRTKNTTRSEFTIRVTWVATPFL